MEPENPARGQVCDRCRLKKIKCHGPVNPCTPCFTSHSACTISAKLKRRRKRSSFHDSDSNTTPTPTNANLGSTSRFLPPPNIITNPVVATEDGASPLLPKAPASGPTGSRTEPVIGHMGRLVSNQQNVAMFGGSSTGVHFVNQADQQLHAIYNQPGSFPNAVYSLHLRNMWQAGPKHTTPSFMQAIVAQLPFESEQAISRVIDHWTPLYPILPKATTTEAYRRISTNPQGPDPCIVYQILLLLALDRFAQDPMDGSDTCIANPTSFSEPFYDLSTQILNQVLERPRLLAIQGLQLTQLYLQLSSRHSLASHLGATATRMAQGIGLHRHSHRFKFSPLETELRRRAWWCQYALDTFSSAYHGMPRLIRDQDNDADMATPADYEEDESGARFPLPGERSPIDSAISFFKLASIMGETLESLYTTTRRRGGVAKISKLQSDLDAWRRTLSSSSKSSSGIDSNRNNDKNDAEPHGDFHWTFLRVASCVVTAHIHRPALAFTTQNEQYMASVKECCRAASSLLELVSSYETLRDVRMAALLYPNGLHMLWQSGLTLLFARWGGISDDAPDRDQLLLASCTASMLRVAGTDPVVQECVGVLERLAERTFQQQQQQEQQQQQVREREQSVWNIWEWPMTSALDLENSFDAIPVYLNFDGSAVG